MTVDAVAKGTHTDPPKSARKQTTPTPQTVHLGTPLYAHICFLCGWGTPQQNTSTPRTRQSIWGIGRDRCTALPQSPKTTR